MTRRKQFLLALLSIFLLLLLTLGLVWGQRFLLMLTPKENYTIFKPMSKKEREQASVEVATKAVEQLETKQDAESLAAAQELVKQLSKSKAKTNLLARLTLIQDKIKNKEILEEAERSVTYLEEHQELSNISLAQLILSKVTDLTAKQALEERVRRVQEAIESRENVVRSSNETIIDYATETTSSIVEGTSEASEVHPQAPQGASDAVTLPIPSAPAPSTDTENAILESNIAIDPRALEPATSDNTNLPSN